MTTTSRPTKTKNQQEVIEAAISAFVSRHPELRQNTVVTEIPPTIRWAGIIIGGVMTAAATAGLFWLVATVSSMQVTLARMDERIAAWGVSQETRYVDIEKRVAKLEARMEAKDVRDATR